MKRKQMAVIGMVVVSFMMMVVGSVWAGSPDADLQKYMGDGTVTEGNLVWLRNANCFGSLTWSQARNSAASLKSGSCGLKDGSFAGQWRLPTKDELIVRQRDMHNFINVQTECYWTSSIPFSGDALVVCMSGGQVWPGNKAWQYSVLPVRNRL